MKESKLIQKYSELHPGRDRSNFIVTDLLHAEGSPLDALLYSYLFWPDFEEYEGMVFLRSSLEDEEDRAQVRETLHRYNGDRLATQQAHNFVDVGDLFGARCGETEESEDVLLAARLMEMWSARLARLFPHRTFVFNLISASASGGNIGIQFWRSTSPCTT